MSFVIGLDVGTSGLDAVVVRADSGEVVATASREYALTTPQPGWAEQNADDFARAAVEALGELASTLGPAAADVRGIGVTGQMHTAVLLDEHRKLVRRAILWCDTRTSAECAEITRLVGLDGLRRMAKNLALEGFTLPKLLWLRSHEPDVFRRVRHVLMPKDWVVYTLTGVLGTDVSDASGTLAFDPEARRWSHGLLAATNINPQLFPRVGESPEVSGELSRDLAVVTGLPRGLPVVRGAADNAAAALGLGVLRPGLGMVSIGTSGVVFAHTDTLRVDARMRLHSFCAAVPGQSYAMGVMLSAGGALRWYRDTFAKRPYDELAASAARSRPGAGGVTFLPYLMGERTPHNDANARGAFVGLSAASTEDDIARSVFEGITFGLCDAIQLMRATNPPIEITELRITGGGGRSPFWRQLVADVLDVDVTMTNSTEGAALGAAMLAAVGANLAPRVLDIADHWVRVVERLVPEPATAHAYREAHATYQGVYGDLKSRFAAAARR